jgi:hypothetical protein
MIISKVISHIGISALPAFSDINTFPSPEWASERLGIDHYQIGNVANRYLARMAKISVCELLLKACLFFIAN